MSLTPSRPLSFLPLLILVWAAHLLVDVMLGIWPVYKSLAQLDLAKAGLVVAIGAFMGEGSQLFFGALSDRGYQRSILTLGLVLAAASAFLAYFTHYAALFSLYLLTCIGSGCFHPSGASLMTGLVPSKRGLLMTIFASGGSVGLAFSQLIFMYVYKDWDKQTYLLALPLLLLALLLFFYPFPKPSAVAPSHAGFLKDFGSFFKFPPLRSLYLSQVANQSIVWGTIFILPDALRTLGHMEWVCYGGGHLCFILGGACVMVPAGYLADKYSARQVMLYAGIISSVAFYFILFSGGISISIVLLSLFILGASLTLINPIAVSLGTRFAPNHPGSVSAFLMGLVWCVSEGLGPGGVGLMSTLFTDYAPVKALAVLGIFFLLQISATFSLPGEVNEMVEVKA
ncbi:MFS transporter [Candidatus Protochlamydia phocaeensis]|uniref:MFS transporter n=1 Tax=Candidatus Protochlamydia phocaeensis TaxID=1414722 RepID=UPI0008396D14|nr:MFS transporter [Candidatus Protochlamydia phocaeensis]